MLAAIYCATVVVAVEASDNITTINAYSAPSDQGVIKTHSIDYKSYLTRPQNLVVPALRVDSCQDKKDFSEYLVSKQVTQHKIACKYQQYIHVSKSFLVKHRKADGIFPFHYFW